MASKALPPALERLVKNLCRLPGIGEKSATRLALQILRWPTSQAKELADSIATLHERIGICTTCYTFSESDPCPICADRRRDRSLVCVVEEPADVLAIEKAGAFRGLYHVLQGVLAPAEGIGPDELKIEELIRRIRQDGIKEVILATSSTAQGEATAAYLTQLLKPEGVAVTRIACGIPMGMDLKYADSMTLKRALESRTSY
jgi:recombination protein RecR